MDFLPPNIQQYAESHTKEEHPVLKELAEYTRQNVPGAQMLSGHLQGQLLQMVSKILAPRQVLDVGTYTGYSALCLAQGVADQGMVHTIDKDEALKEPVKHFIDKADLSNKITQHFGHALAIIKDLDIKVDLAFIDADKKNYPSYYKLILNKLSKGGVILIDNTLWSGKVTKQEKDDKTKAIDQVNTTVRNDDRVDNVLLPIRDGVMFIRKK